MNKLDILSLSLLAIMQVACSEKLNEEDSGDIHYPMFLSAQVAAQTRLNGTQFETGDKIGLFVTKEENALSGDRYYDNKLLTYENGSMIADENLYYPDGNTKCYFQAYYPYTSVGVQSGTSLIPVGTASDQSADAGFYSSDFMTAETSSLPSASNVLLPFKHRLCEISLTLYLFSKSIHDAALTSSSPVLVTKVATSANYDITGDSFQNLSSLASVSLNGEWTDGGESDGKYILTGKRFIAIPQNLSNSNLVITIGGVNYTAYFPSTTFTGGSHYDVALNFTSSSEISSFTYSISNWNTGETLESITLGEVPSYFELSSFSYTNTSTYTLYDTSGRLMGQLCREYLSGDGIDASAIVYYQKNNLQKGTLLQLVDNDDAKCGGSVSWSDNGVLTYVEGTQNKIETIYLDKDGALADKVYDDEAYPKGTAKEYVIEDSRTTTLQKYSVVKIGTQYWMGESLKATNYKDGTEIVCNNEMDNKTLSAGYYTNSGGYFYNTAAVNTLKLAPAGWRIPTTSDYEQLKSYVGSKGAYKLKSTTGWASDDNVTPATNITGLNAEPLGGYYSSLAMTYNYSSIFSFFWLMDDNGKKVAARGIALNSSSDELTTYNQSQTVYVACTVRCVRDY